MAKTPLIYNEFLNCCEKGNLTRLLDIIDQFTKHPQKRTMVDKLTGVFVPVLADLTQENFTCQVGFTRLCEYGHCHIIKELYQHEPFHAFCNISKSAQFYLNKCTRLAHLSSAQVASIETLIHLKLISPPKPDKYSGDAFYEIKTLFENYDKYLQLYHHLNDNLVEDCNYSKKLKI